MERMVKIMGFKFKFLYKLGEVFLICKEKKTNATFEKFNLTTSKTQPATNIPVFPNGVLLQIDFVPRHTRRDCG